MQELDIRAIVSALLSKIKLILLATVVLALAFGLYAKFFIKSTYRSEVQLYVSNYNDLTKNKDYIDKVIKENAEKAAYFSNKTLRKVQKKVGFPERIR